MTEIDKQLDEILEQHIEVHNADKGRVFFTLDGAKKALQDLILREKIAELEKAHRARGFDYDNSTDEYIDERVEKLQNQLKAKP